MPTKHINPHYKKGIQTSKKEIIDLAKAWIILGLAFGIAMHGLKFNIGLIIAIVISWLTIGIGFLFHELAHKFVAQHYGRQAEFRSFDMGLLMALLFSLGGFIFAAPGAVIIKGHLTNRQNGIISAAGPATNLIVSILFIPLIFSGIGIYTIIGLYGSTINAWLALFNMIPVAMFDGKKIWQWNKPIYLAMAIIAFALVFGRSFIGL